MFDTFNSVGSEVEALLKSSKPQAISRKLEDIEREHITWLWTGFIPNKKLVIIDGMPGVGKSTLTAEIAAKVSRGIPFPCGTVYEARNVAFIAVEDGVADTIKPRVEAAGGDGNRVFSIHIEQHGDEITPDLSEHMGIIREKIIEDEIGLLIIDPIMAVLGDKVDSYRDQDVRRRITTPLKRMAEELDVSILTVRHPNKSSSTNALTRGGGSMGFIASARVGWTIAKEGEDSSRRILAVSKTNNEALPKSLSFQLVNDESTGVARIEWLGESELTANDLYIETNQEEKSQTKECMEWLADFLGGSTMSSVDVKQRALEEGFSLKVLTTASNKLKVTKTRKGSGLAHTSEWSLESQLSTYAHENVGISGSNGHELVSQDEMGWIIPPHSSHPWSE
jgi:hypothetical protein